MKDPKLLELMKDYRGRDEVPKDFDSFWNQVLAKMTGLPEYKLEERDFSIPNVICYEFTFKGHEMVLFMRELFSQKQIKRFLLFSIFMVIWAVVGIGQTCWLIQ